MKKYIVEQDTLALVPGFDTYGEVMTSVHTLYQDTFSVGAKPQRIMQMSAAYYGSTLDGLITATKNLMGYKSMQPVSLAPELDLFFFPLGSPDNVHCIWLAYTHLQKVEPVDTKESNILFKNGTRLQIPFSTASVMRKVWRTSHYRDRLLERLRPKRGIHAAMVGESRSFYL